MIDPESQVKAFRDFEETLKRYNQSSSADKAPVPEIRIASDRLQKTVRDLDYDFEEKVKTIYKRYIDAFSADIEKDEESLMKSYDLFRGFLSLNESCGDKDTYISGIKINSTVIKKTDYTKKKYFIFLQAFFMFQKGIEDFIPCIIETSSGYVLEFLEQDGYKWTKEERRILDIIQSNFY